MNDSLLRISLTANDGQVEVEIAGEVDMSSVAAFERALAEALAAKPELVVVDAEGLTFCDLSGVNCLLGAASDATVFGGRLVVRNARRPLRRLLDLTGLGTLLLDGDGRGTMRDPGVGL